MRISITYNKEKDKRIWIQQIQKHQKQNGKNCQNSESESIVNPPLHGPQDWRPEGY